MISRENGFWVDEHNNKWNIKLYSKEQAEEYSKTLKSCYNCIDCYNCIECFNCRSCFNCKSCSYCSVCNYCTSCFGCYKCSECTYCRRCTDCNGCTNCDHCSNCLNCNNCEHCAFCKGFKSNPQRIVSKPIGKENIQLILYFDSENELIVYKNWCGSVDEFEQEMKGILIKNNKCYNDYMKFIKAARLYRKIMSTTLTELSGSPELSKWV